tara:strand:+ start:9 stop:725 length:717 start_codon:yes stop_codon:yes gene_type:complete
MALPQLSVKNFEVRQPSTGEKITLRPFLVSEEKILLQASEQPDSMVDAMTQVLSNCIIGQKLDIDKLPSFDIEFLFLQLRSESVGASVELNLEHKEGCERTLVNVNLREIKVQVKEDVVNEFLLDQKVGIRMRYPTLEMMNYFSQIDEDEQNKAEMSFEMVKKCIEAIYTTDGEVHETSSVSDEELDSFINSMNSEQFITIQKFFEEMPTLKHVIKVPKCATCGQPFEQELQGIQSFF